MAKKLISRHKGWLLGKNKRNEYCYLEPFSWDCGWYWGGGYLEWYRQNRSWGAHTHFDGLAKFEHYDSEKGVWIKEEFNLYDGFKKHIPIPAITDKQIWRLCDLMIQFYAFKQAAACFLHGGHMTSDGRTDAEIDKETADMMNAHIKNVIIPEVKKVFELVAVVKEAA